MTIQIDSRRLPLSVEAGAQWRLTTRTFISEAYGGKEDRKAKRAPRWEASITVNPDEADDIIDLIQAQTGPRYAFAVKCNAEPDAVDQLLEQDDDGNYPLTITYGTVRTRKRRIYLPIESTIVVSLDGTPTSHWTLGPLGVIIPSPSPDQDFGAFDVTASFDFDTPMRIAQDTSAFTVHAPGVKSVQLDLIEVLA